MTKMQSMWLFKLSSNFLVQISFFVMRRQNDSWIMYNYAKIKKYRVGDTWQCLAHLDSQINPPTVNCGQEG